MKVKMFGGSTQDDNDGRSGIRPSRGEMFERYMQEGHISLDQHVRSRIIQAGTAVADRTKIYLDTNFWVALRKAVTGEGPASGVKLLELLSNGVAVGQFVCPLSESAFIELFNQSDLRSRRLTAALMDQLSLGYALAEPETRMSTEVSHYLQKLLGDEVHPLDELVWTKSTFALGIVHPVPPAFVPKDAALALQKGVFDEIWNSPLVAVVDAVADAPVPSTADLEELAERLNVENARHAHEIRSFRQAYKAEARGITSSFPQAIGQILERFGRRAGLLPAGSAWEPSEDVLRIGANILADALEKDRARDSLRTLHIEASLHASTRWDKQRRLDSHDILDFRHAAAALAYCDVFLTEQPLRVMIEQNHIALDKRFNCKVCSSIEKAVAALAEIRSA